MNIRTPLLLRCAAGVLVLLWCVIASFPLLWITLMSVKSPVDAFATDPLDVIFGPATRAAGEGLSFLDLLAVALLLGLALWVRLRPRWVVKHPRRSVLALSALVLSGVLLALVLPMLEPWMGHFGEPVLGFTWTHYQAVWWENAFYQNFINSLLVTGGVVSVSLTVGTLAGYALSRSSSEWAFWLLIIALVFRALPHSVLVTGYLPAFIESATLLRPWLGEFAPTLYGQPWAVIMVLVSINQPFTIWMLRSFFQSIPTELDEAARVDGCTHIGAFWRVIMPVMWPGVITTGLFSFLLAYNDYLVTSLLLDAQNQTMVPGIASYFNRETSTTDQIEAVAAAVSITAPLFLLVMVFQRQIVSGLTAGAVKG